MLIVEPSFEILDLPYRAFMLTKLRAAARAKVSEMLDLVRGLRRIV